MLRTNGLELVFSTWPSRWVFDLCFGSYFVFGLIFFLTASAAFKTSFAQTWRQLTRHRLVLVACCLLVGWYCWQWIAARGTVSQEITRATMPHFTLCFLCFGFGLFCIEALERPQLVWMGLVLGFTIVLWRAMDQRFGELEATRRMIYEQSGAANYPEEFLQRIAKGRVFGTLFYPNALAGVILMLAPMAMVFLHQTMFRFGNVIWGLATGLMGYFAVACLYWSGSKSGWLIAAAMPLALVLNTRLSNPRKILILAVVATLALGAFGIRFSGYFKQGATSAVARFDYWHAAVRITAANPLTGTGPGTFQVPYAALKAPNSEMAKLAHNDYLQQGSDSGIPGFIFYAGWCRYHRVALSRSHYGSFPVRRVVGTRGVGVAQFR